MKKILLILCIFAFVKTYSQIDTNIITLNKILVTSVRADSKTPVTQKTIGDTSIQETYQGQEIPILLGSYPSMNSNSDGGHPQGYSYISLRGASQSMINMTLNGVPLNEPEDYGVYTSNYPSFTTSIKSIQIQRGVGSSTNGTAAFIGSINYQTKDGLKKGNELQLGGGSYNTQRFNISYSSGLSKRNFAIFSNVGGIKTDGFRENSGSKGGSAFISIGHFTTKNIIKLIILSGISQNNMAWDASQESILKNNYRDNPRGLDNEDLFNQTHIQIHNINILSIKSKLTSILFFNHLKGHYDVYNLKDISSTHYYANENQYSNWYGYINQYDYKSKSINLTIGLSLNSYKRNHRGIEYYDSTSFLNYSNYGIKNEGSGFIKVNIGNDDIRLYIDLQQRLSSFKYSGDAHLQNQHWSFFNPKTGIKIFINKNFDVYYTIGISNREPTRSVMFNGGLYLSTLNNVLPEKVLDLEVGTNIKYEKFNIQSNLFMMNFKNEIIPVGPLGQNSLPTMVNVDRSLRLGFEIDGTYNISKNLSFDGNMTLSKSEFGDSNRHQLFSPTVSLNQSLTYTKGKFSLNINQQYFSKSYIDLINQNSVSGYCIFGVNGSYSFNKCKLVLQANNITNKKYYSNGYEANGERYLFPNALCNYYLTIRVSL